MLTPPDGRTSHLLRRLEELLPALEQGLQLVTCHLVRGERLHVAPVLGQAALRELSAGEREVIALRVLLDLDGEEAARVLGISPTAVSTRLSRALKKLEEKVSVNV